MVIKVGTRWTQALLVGVIAWGISGCASTGESLNPFRQLASRKTHSETLPEQQAAAQEEKKPLAEPGRISPANYIVPDRSPAKSKCKTEGG